MKKINYLKIGLDVLMALVFVLLFDKMAIVPMTFHEIAGLGIGTAFIFHMILNSKWIKQVTQNLFKSKLKLKTKLGYIVELLLLLCFISIIVSGVLMSKVVFPNFRINSSIAFKSLHISMSYIALILVGIHIGLHFNWIANVLKKIFIIPQKKKSFGIIINLLIVLLLVFGIYNIYSVNYISKVSIITTIFNGGQSDGRHKQEGESRSKLSKDEFTKTKSRNDAQHVGRPNGFSRGLKGHVSTNIFSLVAIYFSIIFVFSIITFYIDKFLVKKKIKN